MPDIPRVLAAPFGGDNFAWIVPAGEGQAVVIDPGEARPVADALARGNLTPAAFLCTHSDYDHVSGLATLSARFPGAAIAVSHSFGRANPASGARIHSCREGDVLSFGAVRVTCIETPGHTADSMCFRIDWAAACSAEAGADPGENYARSSCLDYAADPGALFTGDTLFAAGCGRVRGSYEVMFQSLRRLAALADRSPETLVYPGHDYLEENLRFAASLPVQPDVLAALLKRREALRNGQEPPSALALEKMTNPFLLAITDEDFARALYPSAPQAGHKDALHLEAFTVLRRQKNNFM